MGVKPSKSNRRWTVDELAFGTGPNAVQLEEVFRGAKIIPIQFFGGRTSETNPSMRRLQADLLAVDQTLKRWILGTKEDATPANNAEEEENRIGFETIIEEDETDLSSPLNNGRWRCRYCTAENKSIEIDCRECKQTVNRF